MLRHRFPFVRFFSFSLFHYFYVLLTPQIDELGPELQKEIDRISAIEDRVAHALGELDYTYMALNDW